VAAAVAVLLAAGVVTVLWQARAAERERARAQHRFEQVRQLANYVIFDLQDGIAKLTGSTELRRQMVERSLAYLDSLAADAAGDVGLQIELAGAYSRLGDVLGKQNAANLGDREGAIASHGKAVGLLKQVISRNPRDAHARRSLARLLINLPYVRTSDRPEERDRAAKRLGEGTEIWQGLVHEDPTDEENRRGLASAHFSTYLLQAGPQPDKAMPHLGRALEIFQGLLETNPGDIDLKRSVALCHKYLSGSFLTRDPPRAYQHALKAAQLNSERVAAEPHNAQAKLDFTFDLSTLGDYHLARREHDDALRYFEQALVLRRELREADRANTYAWNRLAYMLMRVGETHVLAGQHRLGAPFLRESIQHTTMLPEQKQHWVVTTLARAYLSLGEVELAEKRSPCRSYRRMEDLLGELPDAHKYFPPETSDLRDRALLRLKSCPG
jgi:non-specific serine/threonine protein kinase/serine/threonine-protein kinase